MNNINMSSISMVESTLPPGFRFHPRDEELVCDYLFNKLRLQLQIQQNNNHNNSQSSSPHDRNSHYNYFIEVDLNKSEPWEIPESACVGGKEWYFYSQRDRKYATGLRTNRATASGYWKATGKDRPVLRKGGGGALVGMRKTLVFYQGRAPKGRKSDWVMHEFRLEGSLAPKLSSLKEDWVLCRVFYKSREAKLPNNETNFMGGISRASNSLPALMDAYIRFDQPKPPPHISSHHDHHQHDHHQQVSCFSNNNINNYPISSHDLISPNLQNSTSTTTSTSAEAKLGGGVESAVLDPFCGDNENEVLKTLLNQLTSMESNPHLNQFCL